MKRQVFLQELRRLIKDYGSDNIVYVDETGFRPHTQRPHGRALRGKKIFGDVSAKGIKIPIL